MKKIIVISLVLAMLACVCAGAETVKRQPNVDMESVLSDMTVNASFTNEDITDEDVNVMIYDTFCYDIVDIGRLQVGDTIEASLGDVTVETIERDNDMVLINGGEEEDGITLCCFEDSNCYFEMYYYMPAIIAVGEAQFMFADTVTINVYKMNEDLSPAGEGYDTTVVAGTEAGAALTAITDIFSGSVSPYATTVTLGPDEGVITEITIDYVP